METPNLNYVNSLARDDDSFKDLLIDVIKNEFPVEQKEYFESLPIIGRIVAEFA